MYVFVWSSFQFLKSLIVHLFYTGNKKGFKY